MSQTLKDKWQQNIPPVTHNSQSDHSIFYLMCPKGFIIIIVIPFFQTVSIQSRCSFEIQSQWEFDGVSRE